MTLGYNAASDFNSPLRGRSIQVRLNSNQAGRLIRAATARGLRPNTLAIRLLHIVLRENLIDAVLDDDTDSGAGSGAGSEAGTAV